MKFKKFKYILPIVLISILLVVPQVYAKTSIEIKPNASTVYTNKTISEFFDASLAMKNAGEALEGTSVDVHMSTNMDWAIFAYFSNSQYGTGGEGQNTGTDVTIGGKTYKSTNGNITGMMNLGQTTTYTASLISNYTEISQDATVYIVGKRLFENATNNRYVDVMDYNLHKGMAINNWYGAYTVSSDISNPFSARIGMFRTYAGTTIYETPGTPGSKTFRPAIWN